MSKFNNSYCLPVEPKPPRLSFPKCSTSSNTILGSTLSNITCVVNPEVIVIGGGVSKAGAILIDTIQKHYEETAFHAAKDTRFEIASLGNDAGIWGSMALIVI